MLQCSQCTQKQVIDPCGYGALPVDSVNIVSIIESSETERMVVRLQTSIVVVLILVSPKHTVCPGEGKETSGPH